MTTFLKKIEELRVQQKEKIEFVHADMNSQMAFEAQARTALSARVAEETREAMARIEEVGAESRRMNESVSSKVDVLISSLKDITTAQTAMIDSVTGLKG